MVIHDLKTLHIKFKTHKMEVMYCKVNRIRNKDSRQWNVDCRICLYLIYLYTPQVINYVYRKPATFDPNPKQVN